MQHTKHSPISRSRRLFTGLDSLLLTAAAMAALPLHAATLTWDITPGDGTAISGGAGTWSDASGNWNNAGTDVVWSATDEAVFSAIPTGTVTLGTPITAASLSISAAGYEISGTATNSLTLTGPLAASASSILSVPVLGDQAVQVTAGTLTLKTASNGSSLGAISVTDSTLFVDSGAVLDAGVAGDIQLNTGGRLYLWGAGSGGSVAKNVELAGGSLIADSGNFAKFTGTFKGSGDLNLNVASNSFGNLLTIQRTSLDNTYTGDTRITNNRVLFTGYNNTNFNPFGTDPAKTFFLRSQAGSYDPVAGITFNPGAAGQTYTIPQTFDVSANNGRPVTVQLSDSILKFTGPTAINTADEGSSVKFVTQYGGKDLYLDGVVSGSGNVIVSDINGFYGEGALRLTHAANPFSGTITVNASSGASGILALDNDTAAQAATITLNNGRLRVNAPNTTIAGLGGDATGKVLNADATERVLTVSNATENLFEGSIGDATANGDKLSLVKSGSALLTLAGASTYTGTTTISAGTLAVTNTTGSATGTGSVTVETGGTLAGSGTITGSVNVAGTISPTGTLATGGATITGIYLCELDGGSADKLAVTGDLNITGASLDVDTLEGGATAVEYVIAAYTGTLTGTFTPSAPLPAGYSLSYTTGEIKLVSSGGGDDYASWETVNGITGAGADVDSDNDGIPNGIEFVIGGDPSGPDSDSSALLPTITKSETHLTFVFRRTDASAGYNPFVEYGSDLSGWTEAIPGEPAENPVTISEDNGFYGAGIDRVTVVIPLPEDGGKLFARLNAGALEQNP